MNYQNLVLIILIRVYFGRTLEINDIKSTVDVICSWKGFLPDPYSCTHFLICDGLNQKKATKYSCPENSRYDPQRTICVSSSSIYCYEMKNMCYKRPNGTVLEHPLMEGVYASCGTRLVLTCPSHHYRPNGQTVFSKKCIFKCPGEGFFPEPMYGGQIYHACVLEGDDFVDHIRVCAEGTLFLPPNTFCTPAKNMQNTFCTTSAPTSVITTEKVTSSTEIHLEHKDSELTPVLETNSEVTMSPEIEGSTISLEEENRVKSSRDNGTYVDWWGV